MLQQSAALLLATASSLRTRWLPSEWNPADAVSRELWTPSVPKKAFWKDDTPAVGNSSTMGQQETETEQSSQTNPNNRRARCPQSSHRCSETGSEPRKKSDFLRCS